MNEKLVQIGIVVAVLLGVLNFGILVGISGKGGGLGGTTADNWTVGGNLSVTGTGGITGAATLSSTLAVTGATTLSSTLTVANESNLATLVFGGDVLYPASSSASTTLTAAQVCNYAFIKVLPPKNPATTSLPAAADLIADCIPAKGDSKFVYIQNATTGNAYLRIGTTTEERATGTQIFWHTNFSVASSTLAAGDMARLHFITVETDDDSSVSSTVKVIIDNFERLQ